RPQRHPGRHSRRHHPRGEPYVTVTEAATDLKVGRIVAIVGPVVDVEFPPGQLPELQGALEFTVEVEGEKTVITAEVAQHIGYSRGRAICLKPSDGLVRGTEVRNLGRGITVPVGNATLGHVFNVIGEPLDTRGESVNAEVYWQIHRPPPSFDQLEPQSKMFETGLKVVDLLEPYVQGGKIGL